MSDLLSAILSDDTAVAARGITDVRIKFGLSERLKARQRKALDRWLQRGSSDVPPVRAKDSADFLIVRVAVEGRRVVIEILWSPEDESRSQHLLTHGTVLAKGQADARAFIAERWGDAAGIANTLKKGRALAADDEQSHQFFIVGEDASGHTLIDRAEKLIGDRGKAEAWFRYAPLPAFGNKTANLRCICPTTSR